MLSDDLRNQVRARLDDPIAVCTTLGLVERAKRQPGGVVVCCPVHKDTVPSCSVTRGKDSTLRWKCFSCGATGDVFTLIAAVNGIDCRTNFVDVLVIGAGLAGIHIESEPEQQPRPARPAPTLIVKAPVEQTGPSDEDFAEVIAPLAHLGKLDGGHSSREVCSYLDGRGLLEAARADGWFAIAPTAGDLVCGVFGIEKVFKCGLCDERGQWRWPEHSLAIPWRNPAGIVQTIQRRHLGECDAKRRYVFPNGRGPLHPYGIERLQGLGPVALVEGAADVLAWRLQAPPSRYETPLGVPGVSGWKGDWDALVAERIVVIAYDDDDAGNREVPKLDARLRRAGVARVRRATPVRGKDWADGLRRSA